MTTVSELIKILYDLEQKGHGGLPICGYLSEDDYRDIKAIVVDVDGHEFVPHGMYPECVYLEQ